MDFAIVKGKWIEYVLLFEPSNSRRGQEVTTRIKLSGLYDHCLLWKMWELSIRYIVGKVDYAAPVPVVDDLFNVVVMYVAKMERVKVLVDEMREYRIVLKKCPCWTGFWPVKGCGRDSGVVAMGAIVK